MRAVRLAEWILQLLEGRKKAATIVVDLIEEREQQTAIGFWISFIGVAVSLAWKRVLGLFIAFYAGAWAFTGFQAELFGINSLHHPPEIWQSAIDQAIRVAAVLWIVSMYSAVRYGLRDRMAQLFLSLTAIMTLVVYYWWQPGILATAALLVILLLTISIRTPARRKTLFALPVIWAASFAGFSFIGYLNTLYFKIICSPGLVGSRELHAHASIAWVEFAGDFMLALIITYTCTRMHSWASTTDVADPE
jgi:hypothetical protein